MIEINYAIDGVYSVYFNKKKLGAFVMQEDDYFGFYPDDLKGYWSSHSLRLIADKLDEVNQAWDEHIKENIK